MTARVRADAPGELPIFSPRLDEVMAAMIKGEAPNAGRFCGYCYTPLSKTANACSHCGTATADYAPVDRLPREFGQLYRRMRKRENLIVNSFAFAGSLCSKREPNDRGQWQRSLALIRAR